MSSLIEIPTQTFATREAMDADRAANPWFQNRYVFIVNDELYGGGSSWHLFRNATLTTLVTPVAPVAMGVPPGGVQGQILAKKTNNDFDTEWIDNLAIAPITFALLLKPGVRLQIKPGVNLQITQ